MQFSQQCPVYVSLATCGEGLNVIQLSINKHYFTLRLWVHNFTVSSLSSCSQHVVEQGLLF